MRERPPRPQRVAALPASSLSIATTMGVLVGAKAAMERLMARDLPIKTSYHLSKLVKLVNEELTHYQERRNAMIKQFGTDRPATVEERVVTGQATICEVSLENVNRATFVAQHNELDALEVTIAWRPIAFEDLTGIDISAADILALDALLAEPVST